MPTRPEASRPSRVERVRAALARYGRFICTTRAPYQAAVFRIGLALAIAAFLLREWPHRRVLYGDRSPLSHEMALELARLDGTFSVLYWSGGQAWFEIVYALTIASALAVLVGWRTRTTSVLLMVGTLSLENRNPLVGDGGDNAIRIMVIYLVFTRCAQVWSLDARRARALQRKDSPYGDRTGVALWSATGLFLLVAFGFDTGWPLVLWILWGVQALWYVANRWFAEAEGRALLDAGASLLHNTAMLTIAVQVCLIYATSGWYKVQGSRWQEGSALHYALNLEYFAPWPWLSAILAANTVMVLLMSYGTVILQVAFPFTLANRKVKNVLLAVMIVEHAGIAVVLGIPFFSMVMIACDAVFLPTAFLLWCGTRCTAPARRAGAGRNAVQARRNSTAAA
ncbi:HTTM domain-containing protein [Streptomyces sp. NBC_00038]|uniref:HTTM domain-containing protein n=1 Tax=Streptomyces sp. NBC_00038 TaxID=2903615 RepID=UPI0022566DF8|nr:HTTM domain-containing protein [Streptomyces sp. NBC_00038]MCX5557500.1 HTTM domain-containing protein [Streptomyces sp. NBC_00038]